MKSEWKWPDMAECMMLAGGLAFWGWSIANKAALMDAMPIVVLICFTLAIEMRLDDIRDILKTVQKAEL